MVLPATSSGAVALSLKVALISTGVLSAAVILKNSVPLATDFASSDLHVLYSSLLSWLRPPYIYLVVNCIIISIVASSKLQLHKPDQDQPFTPLEPVARPGKVVMMAAAETTNSFDARVGEDGVMNSSDAWVREDGVVVESGGRAYGGDEEGRGRDEVADSSILVEACEPRRIDYKEFLYEKEEDKDKLLVSSRFGHRKSLKASPEVGKTAALGVSRPKRNDTLESTWKTITKGRAMPLTRHLKKSDTWNSQMSRGGGVGASLSRAQPLPLSKTKKSETFSENRSKNKLSHSQQGSEKLRREPSLSQDELNRRVEAFINKFNEEMRLQRQASLNRYHEMISCGA